MPVSVARMVLTGSSAGRSAPPRLQSLSRPVDTNLTSDPVRSPDISPHQNTSLHQYDEDVVRELSLPPDSVSPSATTRSPYQSNGFPTHCQPEGTPSSYLNSPLTHNVPLEHSNPRLRTSSVPSNQPSLFAHHGLPASLPPHPRTTFFTTNSQIPQSEPVPEADNIVSYFDSLLRGSYSHMLSKKSDTSVSSSSAPELPPGAEVELSLGDMLRPDYLDSNTFEEFLTSPLLQDDSPEETPFLETPREDVWTSPMVDPADDSFGFSEMPLFGAAVRRGEQSSEAKPAESLNMLQLLQLYSPAEPIASSTFESSKVDSVTPALDPMDTAVMYAFPPTPALAPVSLYSSPRRPSTLPLAPSSPSTTPSAAAATTSNQPRPTKPMPTGTRRNITPSALVPLDAPTQHRQYVTPSATSRKVLPAAFAKGKKRARSEVDGGGDDADSMLPADGDVDPNTKEAIEAKRRQNTLAARRSRQRKLEHIRELEDTVERITQDRDVWMARAYDAEAKLRENGLS